MSVLADVFTVEEIARAAGCPSRRGRVAVVMSGAARALPGTAVLRRQRSCAAPGFEARRALGGASRDDRHAQASSQQTERTPFGARRRVLLIVGILAGARRCRRAPCCGDIGVPRNRAGRANRTAPRVSCPPRPGWRRWRRRPSKSTAAPRRGNAVRASAGRDRARCVTEQDSDRRSPAEVTTARASHRPNPDPSRSRPASIPANRGPGRRGRERQPDASASRNRPATRAPARAPASAAEQERAAARATAKAPARA